MAKYVNDDVLDAALDVVATALSEIRSEYWKGRLALMAWKWRVKAHILNVVRMALGMPRRVDAHSIWTVKHRDAQGRLLWADVGHNMLHDQGEEFFCKVLFTEEDSPPANYYIGLDARVTLAEADALNPTGEPTGNGYARQPVASDDVDFTISQEGGDYQALTKTVTFTADGGNIGPVTKMFLATSDDDSGVLVASKALSQSRTLSAGESLDCSLYIRFGE